MSRKHSWLITLLAVVLLAVACGPEMATPTPGTKPADTSPPPTTVARGETPEAQPSPSDEVPEGADDWHVLGAPDAPVTIIEYSDFQ